jgi:hypothetical protein
MYGTYIATHLGLALIMREPLSTHLQVEKIFGPGNQYVTAAKMILQVCSCSSIVKLYQYLLCQDMFSMSNCFCGSNFSLTAEQ